KPPGTTTRFFPSTKPLSRNSSKNASTTPCLDEGSRKPSRYVRPLSCARAAHGHAAEQGNELPPSHAWRPPASTARSVYRTLSLLRRARQVLGADLNCSEFKAAGRGLMSALGQNRTSGSHLGHVRFTPETGLRGQTSA